MQYFDPDYLFAREDAASALESSLYPQDGAVRRVVGVTSAVHGEGVTTIARRLALGLTQAEGEVILVKSTHVTTTADELTESGPAGAARAPGIIDILSGSATIEQATHCCGSTKLKQLTVGTSGSSDGALIRHRGWQSLLQLVRKHHRWVIVDLPPIAEGADALRVGQMLDGMILVIRANHTRAPVISRSYRAMLRSGIRVHGAVLNRYEHVIPEWAYNRL